MYPGVISSSGVIILKVGHTCQVVEFCSQGLSGGTGFQGPPKGLATSRDAATGGFVTH